MRRRKFFGGKASKTIVERSPETSFSALLPFSLKEGSRVPMLKSIGVDLDEQVLPYSSASSVILLKRLGKSRPRSPVPGRPPLKVGVAMIPYLLAAYGFLFTSILAKRTLSLNSSAYLSK
jgi:hypothetical protein